MAYFFSMTTLLLCLFVLCITISASDNRDQCKAGFSGIVCYPIDCCNRFVQCVDGVLYPPQVALSLLAQA